MEVRTRTVEDCRRSSEVVLNTSKDRPRRTKTYDYHPTICDQLRRFHSIPCEEFRRVPKIIRGSPKGCLRFSTARAILLAFEINSCLFIPNRAGNYLFTYTISHKKSNFHWLKREFLRLEYTRVPRVRKQV